REHPQLVLLVRRQRREIACQEDAALGLFAPEDLGPSRRLRILASQEQDLDVVALQDLDAQIAAGEIPLGIVEILSQLHVAAGGLIALATQAHVVADDDREE